MGDYGIMLVTTEERDLAKKFDVLSFPALGLFRNGEYVPYDGDLNDEMRILEWITDTKVDYFNEDGSLTNRFSATIKIFIFTSFHNLAR